MLNYTIKRLGLAALVVAVVIAVLFLMIYIIPGDPLTVALGPRANPDLVAALRVEMGLDQPIYVQLWHFYRAVLTGDLGRDVLSEEPVLNIILQVLPDTLLLILGAMTWSILIGIPLGCLSAMYPGSLVDRVTAVLAVSMIAVGFAGGAEPAAAPASMGPPAAAPHAPGVATDGAGITVRYFPSDDSVFIDDAYLIKGVPGRIFQKLLQLYLEQHRQEFTNKEIRLDPSLKLPEFQDNLEARLVLLRRRLEERTDVVRLDHVGRGRLRLSVVRPIRLKVEV